MGWFLFRKWVLAAVIMALPTYALAQVESGVESNVQSNVQGRVQSNVFSEFARREKWPERTRRLRYSYSTCWQAVVVRKGVVRVWNCQPYPPP